jgi:hypothetical protein
MLEELERVWWPSFAQPSWNREDTVPEEWALALPRSTSA